MLVFIHFSERSMAYAAQKAWLRNATLRDNITFGRGYNEIRYNEIIEACALKDDIGSLVGGDLTEIGEKVRFFNVDGYIFK